MRPHHFQQHDRYLEAYVESRVASLRSYSWGLTALELDAQALALEMSRAVLKFARQALVVDKAMRRRAAVQVRG